MIRAAPNPAAAIAASTLPDKGPGHSGTSGVRLTGLGRGILRQVTVTGVTPSNSDRRTLSDAIKVPGLGLLRIRTPSAWEHVELWRSAIAGRTRIRRCEIQARSTTHCHQDKMSRARPQVG